MVAAATRILNGKNPVAIPIRLASKIGNDPLLNGSIQAPSFEIREMTISDV